MLLFGYYYAPLTGYYAWSLINLQHTLLTNFKLPCDTVHAVYMLCHCAWCNKCASCVSPYYVTSIYIYRCPSCVSISNI